MPLLVEKAFKNQPLTIYGGSQTLDLVWIETVVDVLVRSAFNQHVKEPVNIGTGRGVGITQLARRIVDVTQSQSTLEFLPARDNEVAGFVADIGLAQKYFALASPEDPLAHLSEVVDWFRTTLNQGPSSLTKKEG